MDKRHLGKIYPGLDLCDVNGAKIGTIARIYREDEALVSYGEPTYQEIVKTGFLGFGKRLYVPLVGRRGHQRHRGLSCQVEEESRRWLGTEA